MRYFLKLFFCLFAFCASAEVKTVRIATADFPPFEYYDNGKLEGINIKTISDVLSRAGYKAEFYSLPWKRALVSVKSGDLDAIASMPKTPNTSNLFIFSNPIMYTQYYFLKSSNLKINPKNFSDIKIFNIGTIDKYFYNEKFSSIYSTLQLSPITSPTPDVDNLEKLSHNRVDLVACSIHVCKYWLAKYKNIFSNIDFLSSLTVDDGHTLHLAFSKSKEAFANEVLSKFNQELKKYIEEGGIEKNISSYPESGFDLKDFDHQKLLNE